MDRRAFLAAVSAALPLALVNRRHGNAQDLEFLRALEAAQADRPAAIQTSARIAPEREPGTPMVIRGRVVDATRKPAAGAIVFAYHTDRDGLYDRPGRGPHTWRLRGWARTDADGRFEFKTMRPGAYPGRNVPAHVHFNVYTAAGNYHAGELRFADDALVREDERGSSARAEEFGWVRPVSERAGTQYVDFSIRLDPARRF
jgi:protocatechuate 3,4-dioxygenase beta subunit